MSGQHRAQQGSSGGFSSPGIWPVPESTGSIESARGIREKLRWSRGGSASPSWGRPGPNPGAPDSFAPGLLHKEAEEGFPAGVGGAAWDKPQVWQGRGVRWHQERWHQKRWQGSRGAAGRGTDRAAAPGCGWWYGRPCWVRRMCGRGALGSWVPVPANLSTGSLGDSP